MNLVELILVGVFLVVTGVISFYGSRWHWGRMHARPRKVIQALLIIAGMGACFALGCILYNWS